MLAATLSSRTGRLLGTMAIAAHVLTACTQAQPPGDVESKAPPAAEKKVAVPEGTRAVALHLRVVGDEMSAGSDYAAVSMVLRSSADDVVRDLEVRPNTLSIYGLPPAVYTIVSLNGLRCGSPYFVVRDDNRALMIGQLELSGTGPRSATLGVAPPTGEEVEAASEVLGVPGEAIDVDLLDVSRAAACSPAPVKRSPPPHVYRREPMDAGEVIGAVVVGVAVTALYVVLIGATAVAGAKWK